MSALKLAVTMLDVTTLEGADSVGKGAANVCQSNAASSGRSQCGTSGGRLCLSQDGEGGRQSG